MARIAWWFVALVALLHVGFMALEILRWPETAMLVAGFDRPLAESVKVLGLNQGLYNGFLAAGLIWSLNWPPPALHAERAYFFLICVLIAGVFGDFTMVFFNDAMKTPNHILLILQALPAFSALVLLWLARRNGLSKMTT